MRMFRHYIWASGFGLWIVIIGFGVVAHEASSGTGNGYNTTKENTRTVDTKTISVLPNEGILASSKFSAVWANNGQNKVPREDLWASSDPQSTLNSVWNGSEISIFGARNEVVAFALILEAGTETVSDVNIFFDSLSGPNGHTIASAPATGEALFNWTNRPIELFYVRYLQIRGLSSVSYGHYDERHIPERFRRPWAGEGEGSGSWTDRPDHDKHYPEIAVPLELESGFTVNQGESQMVWVDIYIPKSAHGGVYTGEVHISEGGVSTRRIPVNLMVRDFELPDLPSLKTMVYYSYENINQRYLNEPYPWEKEQVTASRLIRNRHFMMAHRHKLSLIDSNDGFDSDEDTDLWPHDRPRPEWEPRLDGSLFTQTNGYDGPGVGVGNNVYSIGTYGNWGWQEQGETAMRTHSDGWAQWFAANAPDTSYFLYLIDESHNYPQIEQWATWLDNNPGPGQALMSLATLPAPDAVANTPSLDIAASTMTVGIPEAWQGAVDALKTESDRRIFFYNGSRPATGSFATEDDGVALRVLAWSQYKHDIDRWFFWESTYYKNNQAGEGETNVFETAATFGNRDINDPEVGEWGWNHSNGDGVLFYPGTDRVFPDESYGLNGPLASLRLKLWRRGIQDGDYLALAAAIEPGRVQNLIAKMLPRSMWEYGVSEIHDPTWVHADISWSNDPADWEAARAELADIIEGK